MHLSKISDGQNNDINFLYDRGTLKLIVLCDQRQVKVETDHRRITKLTLLDQNKNVLKTLATYSYDKHGFMTSCRAAIGCSFDYKYSEKGELLRWSDLSKTWMEHDFDEKGRVIRSRGADSLWCDELKYDDENKIVFYKSGIDGVKRYYRDDQNNIIRVRFPNGDEVYREWSNNQLVAEYNSLDEKFEFEYNDWGQITKTIAPDGTQTINEYDPNGNLLTYTNPLGAKWNYKYDQRGNLLSTLDPLENEWGYQYKSNGQGMND